MLPEQSFFNSTTKEVLFQVLLHIVLFLFFSFDKNEPQIDSYNIFAFLNYAVGAFIINYVLLPRFFYKKKYIRFFLFVIVIVGIIIFVEEQVLEKIYFPDHTIFFMSVYRSTWHQATDHTG